MRIKLRRTAPNERVFLTVGFVLGVLTGVFWTAGIIHYHNTHQEPHLTMDANSNGVRYHMDCVPSVWPLLPLNRPQIGQQ